MSFSLGVAMTAFSIIAIRGAFLVAHGSAIPDTTRHFLGGQVFAVMVTGMMATGPILIVDSLATVPFSALSAVDLTACAAIAGLGVVVWLALGRWAARRNAQVSATATDQETTPPTHPTTHGVARKRAA